MVRLRLRDRTRGQQGARGVVGDRKIGLVEDRLRILQQRQHVALLGDIAVGVLPALDAFGLVLLPQSGVILASRSSECHAECGDLLHIANPVEVVGSPI